MLLVVILLSFYSENMHKVRLMMSDVAETSRWDASRTELLSIPPKNASNWFENWLFSRNPDSGSTRNHTVISLLTLRVAELCPLSNAQIDSFFGLNAAFSEVFSSAELHLNMILTYSVSSGNVLARAYFVRRTGVVGGRHCVSWLEPNLLQTNLLQTHPNFGVSISTSLPQSIISKRGIFTRICIDHGLVCTYSKPSSQDDCWIISVSICLCNALLVIQSVHFKRAFSLNHCLSHRSSPNLQDLGFSAKKTVEENAVHQCSFSKLHNKWCQNLTLGGSLQIKIRQFTQIYRF